MALPKSYSVSMRAAILRMLVLASLMLMPFGMAGARAAPVQDHRMSMAMPTEHYPKPQPSRHSTAAFAGCEMACASALPATDLEIAGVHPVSKFIPEPAFVAALAGIDLEIATPPPRRS